MWQYTTLFRHNAIFYWFRGIRNDVPTMAATIRAAEVKDRASLFGKKWVELPVHYGYIMGISWRAYSKKGIPGSSYGSIFFFPKTCFLSETAILNILLIHAFWLPCSFYPDYMCFTRPLTVVAFDLERGLQVSTCFKTEFQSLKELLVFLSHRRSMMWEFYPFGKFPLHRTLYLVWEWTMSFH